MIFNFRHALVSVFNKLATNCTNTVSHFKTLPAFCWKTYTRLRNSAGESRGASGGVKKKPKQLTSGVVTYDSPNTATVSRPSTLSAQYPIE